MACLAQYSVRIQSTRAIRTRFSGSPNRLKVWVLVGGYSNNIMCEALHIFCTSMMCKKCDRVFGVYYDNPYYRQQSCRARCFFGGSIWSTLQTLSASCSQYAKRMFQKTYAKTAYSIMCEVCICLYLYGLQACNSNTAEHMVQKHMGYEGSYQRSSGTYKLHSAQAAASINRGY